MVSKLGHFQEVTNTQTGAKLLPYGAGRLPLRWSLAQQGFREKFEREAPLRLTWLQQNLSEIPVGQSTAFLVESKGRATHDIVQMWTWPESWVCPARGAGSCYSHLSAPAMAGLILCHLTVDVMRSSAGGNLIYLSGGIGRNNLFPSTSSLPRCSRWSRLD